MIEEGINPSQNTAPVNRVVVYYVTQPRTPTLRYTETGLPTTTESGNPDTSPEGQLYATFIQPFLDHQPQTTEVVEYFTEVLERRTNKWPTLAEAIRLCQSQHATLVIAKLGTLASNEFFTQQLLNAGVPFHCCDQPFVNHTILEGLHKHAQVQKKLHGELIREGLKLTSAKSGNPNAAEVISKVNKPKIDTAILFAFVLQIIVQDYRQKGYSQRQMVKHLNDEGFTAPEGGRWVLSQLQKVLERVRLNELAQQVAPLLPEFRNQGLSPTQMADTLNEKSIPALKRTGWSEPQVQKLLHRVHQIEEICAINQFVLQVLPILRYFTKKAVSTTEMLKHFENADIPVTHHSLVADMAI